MTGMPSGAPVPGDISPAAKATAPGWDGRRARERHGPQDGAPERECRDSRIEDRLLSHVSQELRAPLDAVLRRVTLVLDGLVGDLNPEQREHLEAALRSTRRLGGMIDHLLEAARSEVGHLSVRPRVHALSRTLSEALATLAPTAARKGLTLKWSLDPGLPPVHADSDRVRQVVGALVDNALKFTPDGGRLRLEARVWEDDPSFVKVTVADTGIGIPEGALERVFDRLYQEASSLPTGRKGLGLGLHISRELVTRQGGRIWATSRPGEGSEFCFTLPAFSVARLLEPLIPADGADVPRSVAVVGIHLSAPATGVVEPEAVADTWTIAQRCVLPDRDVLVPQMASGGDEERLVVVGVADGTGARVLTRRLADQLERSEVLAVTGTRHRITVDLVPDPSIPRLHERSPTRAELVAGVERLLGLTGS